MTYLEAVILIKNIEASNDVMSIKYKDVPIWPLLRIHLIDAISKERSATKTTGNSAIKQVLSTLFYYNPLNIFKGSQLWLFAGNERRKLVDDKYILRVSGGILEVEPKTLVIEKPSANQTKHSRRSIPEERIVSESWILLSVHIIAYLLRFFKQKIDSEELLIRILKENNLNYNYKSSLRLLVAQKKVFDFILSIVNKPSKVLIECPYTIMGYVWSLHCKGIPVIELQHGVLNEHHYAYNSLYHSKELYPDIIWVFGEIEYKYLTSSLCHYSKQVEKIGLYFMELADKYFTNDIFKQYRAEYDRVIVAAGQRGYEEQFAAFINEVAQMSPRSIFIYIPRTNDVDLVFKHKNILFKPGVNIYEYMKWCDIHCTISSTTCLECQYFHKPTIFYDYDKMATNYYGNVLHKVNGVHYIDSASAFVSSVKEIEESEYIYKEVFTHNTVKLIKNLLD